MNFKEYLSHFKQVVDKEVEGWFYPKDIIIIYGILNEIQKPVGDICEIGVAFGKSAVSFHNLKLITIFICMISLQKKLELLLKTTS
jgi:cephalosporin hydroxylase